MDRILLLVIGIIIGLAATGLVLASDFPKEQAAYMCDTAPYYYTTDRDTCLLEQYNWWLETKGLGLNETEYQNAVWYGEHYGYMGEVRGIDFKKVLERARYVKQ